MKFEVNDKREQKEGLVFKKSVYYANIRVELNDEEFETLTAMANEKDWKEYPIGTMELNDKHSLDMTMSTFYGYVKRDQGVWETSGRANSPELREYKINQIKEIATTVKAVLETRMSALAQSDEDVSVEL